MGRQRTINDQSFWRSPRLQNTTIEDKVANLHLLTAPDSNIIGSYCLVPRIAAAEIRLSEDQWLQIMISLEKQDLAQYDVGLMFVWVKNWWDHHNAKQIMGPKLRDRTIQEIKKLPEFCRDSFICDFRQRISKEHQKLLDELLQSDEIQDQGRNGYDTDTISNFSLLNTNLSSNTTSTLNKTSTVDSLLANNVDNSKIPEIYRNEVDQALEMGHQRGLAKAEPQQVIDALVRQFESHNPPRSPGGLAYFLSQHLKVNESKGSFKKLSGEELEALSGRCFAWPCDFPKNFVRIGDFGHFDLFTRENGQFLRRVGMLNNSNLPQAIREQHVFEISSSSLEDITQEKIS